MTAPASAPDENAATPAPAGKPPFDVAHAAALLQAVALANREPGVLDVIKDVCIVIVLLSGMAVATGLGAGVFRWGFGL